MDTFDAIARRTSTRSYRPDPLPRHVLERLLASAVRAPNHKLTEPWRFAVLTGESRRRFAELRRDYRAKKYDDPTTPEAQRAIDKTFREAMATPAVVIVMSAVSDDPVRREEDYGAVMMAVENLLVAAAADGIGSFLRTGKIMDSPGLHELARVPEGYRVIGMISLGFLAADPEPVGRRKGLDEIVTWLD